MSNRTTHSFCTFENLESRQLFSAGGLNTSFGHNGSLTSPFGWQAYATAVQADGKIILVGSFEFDFAVTRLNANGTVDTSFGTNGLVLTNFAGTQDSDVAEAVAIQPNGAIVVAGIAFNSQDKDNHWIVARYNPNGSLDTTFGSHTGKETVAGDKNSPGINAVAVAPDGNIFFTTQVFSAGLSDSYSAATVQLLPDGTLDNKWGDPVSPLPGTTQREGYVLTNLGDTADAPVGLAFAPDGKVVIGIQDADNTNGAVDIVRYTSVGTLDTSFAGSGYSTLYEGPNAVLGAVFVESDGSILAGGAFDGETFLTKFTPEGGFDSSFNKGRSVLEKYSPKADTDVITSIFMPRPDRIVVTGIGDSPYGDVTGFHGPDGDRLFAAGYTSNGAVDTSFGSDGVSIMAPGGYVDQAPAAMTPDGQIFIAAVSQNNGSLDALVEFNTYQPAVQIGGSDKLIEGDGEVPMIQFTLDDSYNYATTIYYSVGGTAVDGQNYTGALDPLLVTSHGATPIPNPSVTIPAGQTEVDVPVTVLYNPTQTTTLDIVISLTPNAAYKLGQSTTATVTIFAKQSTTQPQPPTTVPTGPTAPTAPTGPTQA